MDAWETLRPWLLVGALDSLCLTVRYLARVLPEMKGN